MTKVAAIVEVNSETDFVAKNADFQAYVEEVAKANGAKITVKGFVQFRNRRRN